ncbi:carboxymuconolactone decarboxylase family protein [Sphingobacterium olei]|uniref:Carboxymuconolactone decarboxylase family protein n=1 Tax=Sphingobacterium olei TaxID=2571155 RepID=A0A4U0NGB8_9SPHI|nr:carboxymuconolactone decarboxylase family protein [Sphingobacterium olei]TJZ53206.1 carboxymuconolactone decarboxylase family protein [Sphingobacterium olei]
MENRFNIQNVQPEAYNAMYGLEAYLTASQLTKSQKELIKIRASQINGCAFCIDMHTKDALKSGETTQRIFLLNAWQETDKFSAEEKALLAITEEVTLIHQHGLTEITYDLAKKFFSEELIAQIIMAVVTINAWNRIAISTRLPVAG